MKFARLLRVLPVLAASNSHLFYVANMMTDGISVVDGDRLRETGFIATTAMSS